MARGDGQPRPPETPARHLERTRAGAACAVGLPHQTPAVVSAKAVIRLASVAFSAASPSPRWDTMKLHWGYDRPTSITHAWWRSNKSATNLTLSPAVMS